MKKLVLKFKGIDDWSRPVFVDGNGRFFGDTGHLFDYGTPADKVIAFYEDLSLHDCICYFGRHFGCEPMGTRIEAEIEIILT